MGGRCRPHRRINLSSTLLLLLTAVWTSNRHRNWSSVAAAATAADARPSSSRRRQEKQYRGPGSTTVARVSAIDCVKTAIAGGIAGAVGTATLYPLDAAKTVRQASPHTYRSVRAALKHLIQTKTVYRGAWTAIIGAIPSSALYFGAYETSKRCMLAAAHARHYALCDQPGAPAALRRSNINNNFGLRLLLHSSAAATGNLVSSAVFVPKELIKQRLQYGSSPSCTWLTVIADIVHDKGVMGLYTGYLATVLRNVPSAALRFSLYEELKRHWTTTTTTADSGEKTPLLHWRLFAAGAVAGALASGIMTPIDVLKTRLSTGTCPVDLPGCMQHIVQVDGWSALFAGAGSRMATSAAFSSIGFGTFEAAKRLLGIPPLDNMCDPPVGGSSSSTQKKKTSSSNKLVAIHHHQHYSPRPLLDPQYRYCRLASLRLHTTPHHPTMFPTARITTANC
jgi:solute carrier family 25 (mitochondrial S-adenosylmethionine transporter), member 26